MPGPRRAHRSRRFASEGRGRGARDAATPPGTHHVGKRGPHLRERVAVRSPGQAPEPLLIPHVLPANLQIFEVGPRGIEPLTSAVQSQIHNAVVVRWCSCGLVYYWCTRGRRASSPHFSDLISTWWVGVNWHLDKCPR